MAELHTSVSMEAAARHIAETYASYAQSKVKWDAAKTAFVQTGRQPGEMPRDIDSSFANRTTDMQGYIIKLGAALDALEGIAKAENPDYFPKREQGNHAAYYKAEQQFKTDLNTYIAGIAQRKGITDIPEENKYFEPREVAVTS